MFVFNGTKDNYGYDNVDRLTSESRTTGTTQTYSIAYIYDKNGNRTSFTASGQHMQPAASATYTYTGNKLTGYSKAGVGQSISYTANGELIYGTTPTYDNGARRKIDRLSSTEYYYMNYNHKNERSFRDRVVNGAVASMTQYIYDEQSHLVGEYDNLVGVQAEYIWLGDKPIVAIYSSGNTAKIYYIVTDAQNTPRRLIDSSNQAVAWSWDSTAFGLGAPTGTATFNLRFPGQYFDAATGQFYNHNRYYNPELGRYMEPDPIGLEGGLNPYAYAGNNPVSNVDPSGLLFQELSEKALRTPNLDMPSIPQPIFDALMGAANSASLGIGQPFSNWVNGYPTANMDSSAYKIGENVSIVSGVGGILKTGVSNIIKGAVKGCCCYVAGTLINTQAGLQPIEKIKIGTIVPSKNLKTGKIELKPVSRTYITQGKEIYRLTTRSQDKTLETVEVTNNHPYWVQGQGWIDSARLKPNMKLLNKKGQIVHVIGIKALGRTQDTFNIEVAENHNYFVGKQQVLVHNCNCKYSPNSPPVRIDGNWSLNDYKQALLGHPPKGLGSPDLHHADQMPGSGIHEILPSAHRGNKELYPNKYNQGVTPAMRNADKQLHWWYRAREQGADRILPNWIYDR